MFLNEYRLLVKLDAIDGTGLLTLNVFFREYAKITIKKQRKFRSFTEPSAGFNRTLDCQGIYYGFSKSLD